MLWINQEKKNHRSVKLKMKRKPVLGKYNILQRIGKGGYAKVYLGEHIYLKTKAAIKVLRFGSYLSQEDLERFLIEARTIAQLHHPHIIGILDFDVEDNIPYLVMEYAPNGSLLARHPDRSILDPPVIVHYVKQIALALQFAHDHHIVHCDVKPENMLLNAHNDVLLSDFGISVILHTNLITQPSVGTLLYMAPEQFSGKPVPASDQYGLAVVVYKWLCGQFPFNGKNPVEMFQLHSNTPPCPPSEINPHVSRDLEQVVLKALAKDPKQRYASIRAFAWSLDYALQKSLLLPSSTIRSFAVPTKSKASLPQAEEIQLLLPSLSALLPPASASGEREDLSHPPPPPLRPTSQRAKNSESSDISSLPTEVLNPASVEVASAVKEEAAGVNSLSDHSNDDPIIPSISPANGSPSNAALHTSEMRNLTFDKHTGWVSTVSWSPDGELIASGSWDKTVQVWYAATGISLLTYRGHAQPVKCVSWSPDGQHIASGSWDTSIQVWDVSTGEPLFDKYRHEAQVETLAWSPDGRHIASAGQDGIVQVWQASNKRTVSSYRGHSEPIWSLAWSPDSRYLASASHDKTVLIREALTGELVLDYCNHKQQVSALAWSSDGKFIASGDYEGMVHLWDSSNGGVLLKYRDGSGAVKALCWSPKGMGLASAVKVAQVWNITEPLPTEPSFTYGGHSNWINALAWSPDGQTIASASDDKTVQLWKIG
jgi:eukaryotic-like serine/threonine-protein kinase